MILGGSQNDSPLALENVSTRINPPLIFHVNGSLSIYASLSEPKSLPLQNVHMDRPHSVLAELIGSAEHPAAQPVSRPSFASSAAQPALQPVGTRSAAQPASQPVGTPLNVIASRLQ